MLLNIVKKAGIKKTSKEHFEKYRGLAVNDNIKNGGQYWKRRILLKREWWLNNMMSTKAKWQYKERSLLGLI